jgi:hypothetical protein
MNRNDFQAISRLRLREARVLLRNGHPTGAYYLLGYAVECALKACVAKQMKRFDIPEKDLINKVYTHNLETLLNLSGLKPTLELDSKTGPALAVNWAIVKDWSEQRRYDTYISDKTAADLYSAVAGRDGILAWIRHKW